MSMSGNPFIFDYEQFDYFHLLRVVPVAQTRPLGDLTLTVTSLELYQAGFAANLLFEELAEHPSQHASRQPLLFRAMPIVTIHDDPGKRYVGRSRAGWGGGGPSTVEMRDVCNFTPPLALPTGTLTFEVSFVSHPRWNAEGQPLWTTQDIVAGPWQATFTLPEDA